MNHYQLNQYQTAGDAGSVGQQQQQAPGQANVQQFVIGLNGGYHQYDQHQAGTGQATGQLLDDSYSHGSQVQVGGDQYTVYQVAYTDPTGQQQSTAAHQIAYDPHTTSSINLNDWNKSHDPTANQQQQQHVVTNQSVVQQQQVQQPTILQWNPQPPQTQQYQLAGMHTGATQQLTMNQVQSVPGMETHQIYTIQTGQNGQTQLVPARQYHQATGQAGGQQQVIAIKSGEGTIQLQGQTQQVQQQQVQQAKPAPAPTPAKKSKRASKTTNKDGTPKIAKPVSAYALFFRDTQPSIKAENPSASFGEISKIVASKWELLKKDDKDVYKERADAEKRNYLQNLASSKAKEVADQQEAAAKAAAAAAQAQQQAALQAAQQQAQAQAQAQAQQVHHQQQVQLQNQQVLQQQQTQSNISSSTGPQTKYIQVQLQVQPRTAGPQGQQGQQYMMQVRQPQIQQVSAPTSQPAQQVVTSVNTNPMLMVNPNTQQAAPGYGTADQQQQAYHSQNALQHHQQQAQTHLLYQQQHHQQQQMSSAAHHQQQQSTTQAPVLNTTVQPPAMNPVMTQASSYQPQQQHTVGPYGHNQTQQTSGFGAFTANSSVSSVTPTGSGPQQSLVGSSSSGLGSAHDPLELSDASFSFDLGLDLDQLSSFDDGGLLLSPNSSAVFEGVDYLNDLNVAGTDMMDVDHLASSAGAAADVFGTSGVVSTSVNTDPSSSSSMDSFSNSAQSQQHAQLQAQYPTIGSSVGSQQHQQNQQPSPSELTSPSSTVTTTTGELLNDGGVVQQQQQQQPATSTTTLSPSSSTSISVPSSVQNHHQNVDSPTTTVHFLNSNLSNSGTQTPTLATVPSTTATTTSSSANDAEDASNNNTTTSQCLHQPHSPPLCDQCVPACRRVGCNRPAVDHARWDLDYCSDKCCAAHAEASFEEWRATKKKASLLVNGKDGPHLVDSALKEEEVNSEIPEANSEVTQGVSSDAPPQTEQLWTCTKQDQGT